MVSSIRRAAIVLMSIPLEDAAKVISKLQPAQAEAVSIEIAQLGRCPVEQQEEAILAFAEANPNEMGGSIGSFDVAKSLLEKGLGKGAPPSVAAVKQSVDALPFGFLKSVDPQNLLTFINNEHPQTIALILSHLPPAYGAQVVADLTTERQLAVIARIANMGQTNPEIIEQVEDGLEKRMAAVVSQSFELAGGVGSVAEILNVSDRSTEKAILDTLGEKSPELVDDIRRLMFIFEDISTLTDKDIQSILKNVETSQWAMALKGTSATLKEKILGNMSQRAAAMLTEEIDFLGAVRQSEVETIQQQIVDIVRTLEDQGEITRHTDDASEQFVQ
ncbi:MAG: flagellar motor switch protein FliG [Pirellulaceae bacterium]|nr:flagellar motor switch protein FliG [Pirellulaceae bacterium]